MSSIENANMLYSEMRNRSMQAHNIGREGEDSGYAIIEPMPLTAEGLKPCPFCGSSTATVRRHTGNGTTYCVICGDASCRAIVYTGAFTKERAVEFWNRRNARITLEL